MGQNIELASNDGFKFAAYRADPASTPKGAIVVLQEIFGVNHHIRGVTDRFAAAGYLAVAPAVFDRIRPRIELTYDQAGIQEGIRLAGKLQQDRTLADIAAAVAAVAGAGRVGIVGFCWGGTYAFASACKVAGLSAAVGYYGGQIAKMKNEKPNVPTLLHFGDKDESIPMSDVSAIEAAQPDIPVHVYHAGHGFNCDERGSYDKTSADLAWQRTSEFFAKTLR